MINFKKQFLSSAIAGVLISTPLLFPSSVSDPVTLGNWFTNNFTYQAETTKKEHWKTPEETIKDKGGDCEDFAILAQHVLQKLEYEAYIILIEYTGRKDNHAICILKHKDGTFSYYSNARYFGKRYTSVPKLLTGHKIFWKKAWIVISKPMRLGILLWRNKK